MAYNPINFKDGSTPLDASNFNKMDAQIAANADAIDSLTDLTSVHEVTKTGEDMGTYFTPGVYYFSSTYTPTDIPNGSNGWLIVIGSPYSTTVRQFWFRHGTVNSSDQYAYMRLINSGNVGQWYQFTTIGINTTSASPMSEDDTETVGEPEDIED